MTLKLPRIAAGLALSLSLLAACGSPGAFDICSARCDALRRCNYKNDAETTNCHTDCNNTKGTASDLDAQLARECKNAGEIRGRQVSCYTGGSCLSTMSAFEGAAGDCIATAVANQCIK